MTKFNDYGYGLLTNADVELIEKSLEHVSRTFGDAEQVNVVQVGGWDHRTNRQLCRKLSELNVRHTPWIIDNGSSGHIGESDEYNLILGDSAAVSEQAPKEIHWLFIDGCHCCNHVMLDFLNYGNRVVNNGVILFHDTSPLIYKQHLHFKGQTPFCSSYGAVDEAFKRLDIFNRKDLDFIESKYQKNNAFGGVSMFVKRKDEKPKFMAKEKQDLWVLEKLDNKRNGYFVDIGAHNGFHNSNSYALEKHFGWSGICVEPNPVERGFVALKKNRQCICENVCIFSENKTVKFIARGRHPELSGIIHETSSPEIKRVEQRGHTQIDVEAITINNLLDRHNAPNRIDYLSIDTEGTEYEVLKPLDFNRYSFSLISVEHNYHKSTGFRDEDKEKRDNVRQILGQNGYVLDETEKYPHEYEDWFINKDLTK